METITEQLGTLYHPKGALVIYRNEAVPKEDYVEYFDFDSKGFPINAHPLTVAESKALANALDTEKETRQAFLKPKGLIPTTVLHINPSGNECVLWYTKPRMTELFFSEDLGIPNGKAWVPPLIWLADKNELSLYALKTGQRPNGNTPLYHAPFFNVYASGTVCMGTVQVKSKKSTSLEEFMSAWERYFFNSYFSHLMQNHPPVKGDCVELWKGLRDKGTPFPKEVLKKMNKTVNDIMR